MVTASCRGQETAPTGDGVFVGAPPFGAIVAEGCRGQETAPTGEV